MIAYRRLMAELPDRVDSRRAQQWPIFEPTKESFTSFIKSVNEHTRTEADARRSLMLMLTGEWKDAYRRVVDADDNWRTAIDKLKEFVLTPARQAEYQSALLSLQQGNFTVNSLKIKTRSEVDNWLKAYFESKQPELWQQGIRILPTR